MRISQADTKIKELTQQLAVEKFERYQNDKANLSENKLLSDNFMIGVLNEGNNISWRLGNTFVSLNNCHLKAIAAGV